jgi:hypothetical protein
MELEFYQLDCRYETLRTRCRERDSRVLVSFDGSRSDVDQLLSAVEKVISSFLGQGVTLQVRQASSGVMGSVA